jgi:hypothetical protein
MRFFIFLAALLPLGASASPVRADTDLRLGERPFAEVAQMPENARYFPGGAREVVRELSRLLEKLLRWYESQPQGRRIGKKFTFPASTPWTPAGSACRLPGRQYPGEGGAWRHATWLALKYRPEAAHRYQYRFLSIGHGPEASFSLQARGDLDCDRKVSLYRLSGHSRDGTPRALLLRVRRPGQ